MSQQPLVARRLAVVPTLRCTLNCKLCSNHMNRFKHPYDIPIDKLKQDIDRLFELFDYIKWIQFVGGEIFIRDDMAEVYEYTLKYKSKFDKLILMTNATIAPRPAEIEVLKKYGKNCEIMISDYGKYSYKRDEMMEICDKANIPYICKCYNGESQYFEGWIDNTKFQEFKGSEEALHKVSSSCVQAKMKNMHCFNGKLYSCPNSCFMTELGINKPAEDDYVDLNQNDISLEQKRDIIRSFYEHPAQSCHICIWWNADHVKRYPAAQQEVRLIEEPMENESNCSYMGL